MRKNNAFLSRCSGNLWISLCSDHWNSATETKSTQNLRSEHQVKAFNFPYLSEYLLPCFWIYILNYKIKIRKKNNFITKEREINIYWMYHKMLSTKTQWRNVYIALKKILWSLNPLTVHFIISSWRQAKHFLDSKIYQQIWFFLKRKITQLYIQAK